jgi:hypothetical protein
MPETGSPRWMRLDPRMDPLRGEACFREIDARIGNGRL